MCFKNKLDKALALYPDVPRCSESGHTYDRNFLKSNSLCDHYGDVNIKRRIDKMDIALLAVPQDGHALVPRAKLIIIKLIILIVEKNKNHPIIQTKFTKNAT